MNVRFFILYSGDFRRCFSMSEERKKGFSSVQLKDAVFHKRLSWSSKISNRKHLSIKNVVGITHWSGLSL